MTYYLRFHTAVCVRRQESVTDEMFTRVINNLQRTSKAEQFLTDLKLQVVQAKTAFYFKGYA